MIRLDLPIARRALAALCGALLLTGCATTKPEPSASPAVDPKLIQTALEQADRALSRGDLANARKGYRRVLAVAPNTAGAQLGLGEVELITGDPRQALEQFKAAAADPALRAGALQGQGLALIRLGRPEAAEPILKEAVTIDARLWRTWNALGSVEDARRNWAGADEAYRQALANNPDSALVLNNMGLSRLLRRDYAMAEQIFAKALAADPALEGAANNLRIAQAWQGRYQEALHGVDQTRLPQRLNDVGYVAMLRGDLAVAETLFLRAISASPTYHDVAHRNLQELERRKTLGVPVPAVFE
jgi:Flp pilus assembly protein TadD